ncbi:hypothetical protein P256_02562 [Acinetobacter nectaris CIP 110549]|uniref:VOC domain-containing protein n=1 Tax=Acinetobacter nectaris CIP 110549 TaxID=1392540 RepID=V2TKI3_9GAMM|nr:hypothetical protein [Acinetobacter nectaris]ESK36255.1 hypothetical protein P256_02562 [Acinetobacter nectaris CIP 110549]
MHIYVDDTNLAELWYSNILGFCRDEALYFWFEQGGPLILSNHEASIALFKRKFQHPGHTVAFDVIAEKMTTLIDNLNKNKINFIIGDHDISMSVYFCDLYKNKIEITSYEYDLAKKLIKSEK